MVSTILNAFRVADIRKKLLFTAVMLALYRLGAFIPVPGVNVAALEQISENYAGGNILGFLNLFSGGGLGRLAIFALGIMPYITASIILQLLTVVSPSLEKLQREGEVGQQRITQYTRYLTVGLSAAQAIGYVFLFRSQGNRAGRAGDRQLLARRRDPDRRLPDRRQHPADVDGRADHPARHRQRHLADDLRVDRLRPAERHPGVVDEPGPGLQGDDAVRRPRRDRRDRVHPGGPAPDPDPIRQTRDRPPDELRRPDLPAAAREHGRRDPGDLRRVDHGLPADARRARAGPAGRLELLQSERLGVHRRRDGVHHPVHVLLHRGHVQSRSIRRTT